jgi:single-strand DNA-binding protein
MNLAILVGRLTADPELKKTPNGVSVATFSVAVDRRFQSNGERKADFINCVAWRNTAEFVNSYFTKGRMAVVSGRLQIRSWTDKDGNKRKSAEVVADNVYFADSKKEETSGSNFQNFTPASEPLQDFAVVDGDDSELPF